MLNVDRTRVRVGLAALLAIALLGACGGGDSDTDATEPAAEETSVETEETPEGDTAEEGTLEFTATEYAFSVEDTVPAGMTSVVLNNVGEEPHFLDLVPVTDDAPPVEELITMPDKKVGKFFMGQPQHIKTVKPGEMSKPKEIDLKPGRYAYVCFYSEKGEEPHAFKGMVGELTVE